MQHVGEDSARYVLSQTRLATDSNGQFGGRMEFTAKILIPSE